MNITITGSLGNISKPLTQELVKDGHTVTVISSKPERQKDIEALGAIPAIGSLEDFEFIKQKFNGADAVYCMVPPNFGEAEQVAYYRRIGTNYAQAIQQLGVKRIIYLSSWGAHLSKGTGFILGAHHVEGILDELKDVAITHLRAGSFYTNLYGFVDMIKHAGFIGSNYGDDDHVVMVSPKDIATAAAEELTTLATGINVRYVASIDAAANQIAGILGTAIGKPGMKWMTFTNEQTQAGLEQAGIPAHIAAMFVELGAAIHSGIMREDYDKHKPKVMGTITLEEFAMEFAAAFK
jgi:uncharacterized protein YbjT (DUF2867 family)